MSRRDDREGTDEPNDDGPGVASVVLVGRREDIAAICGRVDAAPTFAVVIHAPNGNRQLATELGMRRLARHVAESGKVVGIATPVASLASRARLVGIPVSRRPEHVRWDAGGRRVFRLIGRSIAFPALGSYVQLLFIALVAVFVAVGLLFLGPSSKVVAYPPTETLSEVVTVIASTGQDSFDAQNLLVPATSVSATRTVTLAVPTTGRVSVGTVPSMAVVTITNTGGTEFTIPAGTVLLGGADGPRFLLDAATKVPAGGVASVACTAEKPGVAGNVVAGALAAWVDTRFLTLKVTNSLPATGGLNEEKPAVDARDIAAIKALAAGLEKSGVLKSGLIQARPHDAVFLRTAETNVNYGDPSAPAGSPAEFLLLDVHVEIKALAVVESTLDEVARVVLRPSGRIGEFVPGSVIAVETGARQVDTDSGVIRTELRLQAEFARDVVVGELKGAVKGKSVSGARSTLAERYGIQDAEVTVFPGWAPRLPRFDFRISVELKTRSGERTRAKPGINDASPTPTGTPAATPRP